MYLPQGYDRGIFAEHFSAVSGEQEYIVGPGQRFKIVGVEVDYVSRSPSDPNSKDVRNLIIKLMPEEIE
jgi:hypothetical protein